MGKESVGLGNRIQKAMSDKQPSELARETAAENRFWSRVQKTGYCWVWTGSRSAYRYGALSVNGRLVRAHKWIYERLNGPVPDGLCVCHKCDNPLCVRPDHLFVGTRKDNSRDMAAKGRARNAEMGKTCCLRGHPFTPENTYSRTGRTGNLWRICRTCSRDHARRYRALKSKGVE